MELQQVLEKRQSIRSYKEEDVPEAAIREMVKAAGMAPSGKNIQNWHFVAIKKKELKQKIADVIVSKNEKISFALDKIDLAAGKKFRKLCKPITLFALDAPVFVVVFSTTFRPSGYDEYQAIHADEETLWKMLDQKSPGMQSLGAAIENFSLKAVDLGYGTCWLTSANYASDEIEALLKEEVGFQKQDYFMSAVLSVGVPAQDHPKAPSKKPLDQIYTFVE